jgi:hypothetical protein
MISTRCLLLRDHRPQCHQAIAYGEVTVNDLVRYLRLIVEPTPDEFRRNPHSLRHAYLAAVAIFHCVDRVARTRGLRSPVLRQRWGRKSPEFARVDVLAHDFKHVQATHRFALKPLVSHPPGMFGSMGFNTNVFNDTGETIALMPSAQR